MLALPGRYNADISVLLLELYNVLFLRVILYLHSIACSFPTHPAENARIGERAVKRNIAACEDEEGAVGQIGDNPEEILVQEHAPHPEDLPPLELLEPIYESMDISGSGFDFEQSGCNGHPPLMATEADVCMFASLKMRPLF